MSPVWLPPIFQGCRPNNFKAYSALGGVASSSSGAIYGSSTARDCARKINSPCRIGGLAQEQSYCEASGNRYVGSFLGKRLSSIAVSHYRYSAFVLSLALGMLAVAGKRDHSLGIFAMLAAEFVFIHDAGATGVGALLGSRHNNYLHSRSWMLRRKRTGKHTANLVIKNEVESLRLGYFSGW
jgi:hypothetical protein